MSAVTPPKEGDVWLRVDGEYIDDGSETYVGMELVWTNWRVVKVTPRGVWLKCVERHWKKQRFALTDGARWASRTRDEAIDRLIARKRRQISIVEQQAMTAKETLELAIAAKAATNSANAPESTPC